MSEGTCQLQSIDLCRYYRKGNYEVKALDSVNLSINQGEFIAILGSSGSGKSTLLNIMAGLHKPTGGGVAYEGNSLYEMSARQLASFRAYAVGMIFQSFNLIQHYTALQNVETAMLFNQTSRKERTTKATAILEQIGLSDRLTHRPGDLSGGEQQRVAIARAIVKGPKMLFADEPTGNLDYDNSLQIASLLTEQNRRGMTVILVTHNRELANRCAPRIIRLYYGKIATQESELKDGGD